MDVSDSLFVGIPSPVAVISESSLRHNISTMAEWCASQGVDLAPHGKTTMSTSIFQRQLAAGAWGLTVASAIQAAVAIAAGAERVLVANEVVDEPSVDWIVEQNSAGRDVYVYVDSQHGLDVLKAAALRRGSKGLDSAPVPVLLEIGGFDGRGGVRDPQAANELAALVAAEPSVRLAGVAGYEGSFASSHDPAANATSVAAYLERLKDAFQSIERAGNFHPDRRPIITAGGSGYFDLVVSALSALQLRAQVILRSGCYVLHDDGIYSTISPFVTRLATGQSLEPALRVWASVISRPEPNLAIANAGRRDVGIDAGMPVVVGRRGPSGAHLPLSGATVKELNDQHALLVLERPDELAVGDWIELGVSHPCTTVDRWRSIVVVDDDLRVIDRVTTHF